MPESRLGRWAGWLFVLGLALLVMVLIALNTGLLGSVFGRDSVGSLVLGILATICAVGSLVTGAVSWLRLKDHSGLVAAATIYGALATALLLWGNGGARVVASRPLRYKNWRSESAVSAPVWGILDSLDRPSSALFMGPAGQSGSVWERAG